MALHNDWPRQYLLKEIVGYRHYTGIKHNRTSINNWANRHYVLVAQPGDAITTHYHVSRCNDSDPRFFEVHDCPASLSGKPVNGAWRLFLVDGNETFAERRSWATAIRLLVRQIVALEQVPVLWDGKEYHPEVKDDDT